MTSRVLFCGVFCYLPVTTSGGANPILFDASRRLCSIPARADSDMPLKPADAGKEMPLQPYPLNPSQFSTSYVELYHCLIKMFVDTATNTDDLVIRGSFSKLIDMAVSISRMYGYAYTDVELYKTEDEKEQARRKTFDTMDLKGTDVITVDEWLKVCVEHIIAEAATLPAHPILVLRSVGNNISRDVSLSSTTDGGRPGALSRLGGDDQHGAKEGGHGDEERRQEEKRSHATMRLYACA